MRRPGDAKTLSLKSSPALASSSPASISWLGFALGVLVFDLFAAHLDIAAARRSLFALVGRVFAASLVPFGIIARFLALVLRRLFGRGEIEILEQAAATGVAKASWSSRVSASASSSAAASFLDPGRDEFEPRESGRGRRLAGEPLARNQSQRGRERHFLSIARADDGVSSDAGFGQLGEIVPDPAHGAGAERFDPGHFKSVEHGAGIDVHRRDPAMDPRIVVAKAKRSRIGRSPRLRDEAWFERGPG